MNPFETLASARERGDRPAEATALTDLGVMHLRNNEADRAASVLAEALELARHLNDPLRIAEAQANLGMALLELGRPAEARTHCEQALASAAGNPFTRKLILEHLGVIAARLNEPRTSLKHFGEAASLAEGLGDWQHLAELHWFQAIQHAELEDREAALAAGQAAIDTFRSDPRAAIYKEHLRKYRGGSALPPVFPGGLSITSMDRPSAEPAGPGLLHMALSAAQALGRFVGSGLKTAGAELRKQRLELCANCEHHTGIRCRLCGCFTELKTRLPHEACPAGRW